MPTYRDITNDSTTDDVTTLANTDRIQIVKDASPDVLNEITYSNLNTQLAAATQTLTNKTLTSPTINTATINTATINTSVITSPTGIAMSRYIIKSANETVNNSTTLQNDNDFSFAIAANEKWMVEMFLAITSASATTDYKFNFTLPASCTIRFGTGSNSSIAGTWGAAADSATTAGLSTSANVAAGSFNGTWGLLVIATVINAGTAGTVQYQWAQNTAAAEDTILLANSVMRYTRLA